MSAVAVAVRLPGAQCLSERQVCILQWVADGKTNTEIGRLMSTQERAISAGAVQMQMYSILAATGCASRSAAVAWAMRKGIVK